MKKRMFIMAAITLLAIVSLTGCACSHEWTEATCTEPKTCSKCGDTEGEALGHTWTEATCTEPKTCEVCGETEGEALGHDWAPATCETAETCTRCEITQGSPLGHTVDTWEVTKEATCSEDGLRTGVCTVCGKAIEEKTEQIPHTLGDLEIVTPATSTTIGWKGRVCSVCGFVADKESYSLTEAEKADLFKKECKTYSYNDIARNPSNYLLEPMKFRGEVMQVIEDGDDYVLMVHVTKKPYYWDDLIYVEYTKHSSSEPRILEDDIITLYGYGADTVTYETVMGASKTIPAVLAIYVDIQ